MDLPTPDISLADHAAREVVDAVIKIHRALGPGLLEVVYETCLFHELTKRGMLVRRQVELPIKYEDILLNCGLKIDLLVEDQLIVELKAVEQMIPLFNAQLLSYMKLTNRPVGLLINFNSVLVKDGIKRMVL